MKRLCIPFVLLAASIVGFESQSGAQTDDKLLAPVRPLSLAAAQVSKDGRIEIINTRPKVIIIKEADPDAKPVQQTYTVMIPYTEMVEDEDGKKKAVTKMRAETRTRLVKPGAETKTVAEGISKFYESEELTFQTVGGEKLTSSEAMDQLKKRQGVIMMFKDQKLDPYFKTILKPETIIVRTLKKTPASLR